MRISKIVIFPIKSLDGALRDEVALTEGGILENDRAWAMFDQAGRVVNGKRTARVHDLRCEFDPQVTEVRLWQKAESPVQFSLADTPPLARWLGAFFGFSVELRREPAKGFPDDATAFGPTIISEASLREIQTWFPELTVASLRRRFRANIELSACEPFGEDRLFGAPEELKPFALGPVNFFGHNPCQRCVVPTRDPDNGQGTSDFQKKFMEQRKKFLPAWSDARRFNHYYRFAINTSVPPGEGGKVLRLGDAVRL